MKGIYKITIGERSYIGKDTRIDLEKRRKEHLRLLDKNEHYNSFMQNAYNKHGSLEYEVLFSDGSITGQDLSSLEKYYIKLHNTYEDGLNLTLGGEGGLGYKLTEEERHERSLRMRGDLNPMSKLKREEFDQMVEMFEEGMSNQEIAEEFFLHDRYISLIRHKRRLSSWWEDYPNYIPIKSTGNINKTGMPLDQFLLVVKMIYSGETNASIERKFGLSSGTASRLRHRKTYAPWWELYIDQKKIVKKPE